MPGMTEQSEAEWHAENRKPVTKTKVHQQSDIQPMWITLQESYALTRIPKSSFDKRRKEGHFRTYSTPGCHTVRLRYDEVVEDSENFYAGGKPRHEPDTFLPRRGDA